MVLRKPIVTMRILLKMPILTYLRFKILNVFLKLYFEVIYIGAINTVHLAMAKMYINAGKAVLCEKPLCMNVKETKELVELARSKKVFLMEAVWSRCLPAYQVTWQERVPSTIFNP